MAQSVLPFCASPGTFATVQDEERFWVLRPKIFISSVRCNRCSITGCYVSTAVIICM